MGKPVAPAGDALASIFLPQAAVCAEVADAFFATADRQRWIRQRKWCDDLRADC
jgi:hypothetical protein